MAHTERAVRASGSQSRGRPREFDRDEAVRKAMELFWKNGYMQTTLGDLCKVMNISAPSFYCAFDTKETLFIEAAGHYLQIYWQPVLKRLMEEKDIYLGIKNFLNEAVQIYMRPGLPTGCFLDISTFGLPQSEKRIAQFLENSEKMTMDLFRSRFMAAIKAGQIPPESDIPAIIGSLFAFLKGVASIARKDLCLSELAVIAAQGLWLLPARKGQ